MKKLSNWDLFPVKLGNHVRTGPGGHRVGRIRVENQWNCVKHYASLYGLNSQNTLLYFAVDNFQYFFLVLSILHIDTSQL